MKNVMALEALFALWRSQSLQFSSSSSSTSSSSSSQANIKLKLHITSPPANEIGDERDCQSDIDHERDWQYNQGRYVELISESEHVMKCFYESDQLLANHMNALLSSSPPSSGSFPLFSFTLLLLLLLLLII